jgi:hypothetical protein
MHLTRAKGREGEASGSLRVMRMKRKRSTGQEAPMVISPRDAARLFKRILTSLRGRKT